LLSSSAAALPWPYDLILLDVQMPNKHGDGEKETRPPAATTTIRAHAP
jgi:CheY-like chemotaxis protein